MLTAALVAAAAALAGSVSARPAVRQLNSTSYVAASGAQCRTFKELPKDFEPSGASWDEVEQTFYSISDEGQLASFTADGDVIDTWELGQGDVESLTSVGRMLYIGIEHPATVFEWSLDQNKRTGREWTLPDFAGDSKSGMEALTHCPHGPVNFFAGSQKNGKVYGYTIDLAGTGGHAAKSNLEFDLGWKEDCSGLTYNPKDGNLYALSDNNDEIVIFNRTDGTIVKRLEALPGKQHEGIALKDISDAGVVGEIFIASDDGKKDSEIHRYDYPGCF